MTMRHSLGLLALSTALVGSGCSGRYYEVGGMDSAAGSGSTGSGAAGNGAAAGEGSNNAVAGTQAVGATGSGGSSMSAGPGMPVGEFGPQGVPGGAPPQLAGQFAEPAVVWQRISMLTWGKPVAPLYGLPETTTYAWAGDVARAALVNARDTLGSVPGVETFMLRWLALPATSSFQQPWAESVVATKPVLSELLLTPLADEGRVGVFTEPSWLRRHPTISSRGRSIEQALFNVSVPPTPRDFENPEPNPNLPDRAALAEAIAPPVCASCHQLMDSGFALGRFAADGSYRELDHGLPIDTTGSRRVGMVAERTFDGIEDFGRQFAGSCEATLGFADQFLLAAMAINGVPEGERNLMFEANRARMEQAFVNDGRTYEAAVKAYIQSPAGLRP